MKMLQAIGLFVSTLAASSMLSSDIYGAASSTMNQTQSAPEIPQSMIPRREPLQDPRASQTQDDDSMSVVDLITTDRSFSTLAQALEAADLIETLSGPGPFTVFAPNDAAFAKLSPGALADLLKPENKDQLVDILTYHVVPDQLTSDQLKSSKVKTLQGKPLQIKVNENDISINNAKVLKPDIKASNGIVYIVDTVLMP